MYVVVFRSTVRPTADRAQMRRLDTAAHQEATRSGGLLDYIAGSDDGAQASVCIWNTRADAERAAHLPAHTYATRHADTFYEQWSIHTYGSSRLSLDSRYRLW